MMRMGFLGAAAAATLASACAVLPKPSPPTDRLVGAWTVVEVSGSGLAERSQITLEFAETGRVSGSAGCNRYTGAYSYDGAGALIVTPLGVTRRACPPPLMEQEARFIEALQGATRVETQDDGLVALSSATAKVVIRRRGATPAQASAPAAAGPAGPSVTRPVTDPLAPAAANQPSTVITLPPPSTSDYPLAGGVGAPLYPAPATPAVTPAPATLPLPASAPAAASPVTPITATAPPPVAQAARITAAGEIALPDAGALPADAMVRVQIRDVPRSGPATVYGEQAFAAGTAMRWPFSVDAPASAIAPDARLTVIAQVMSGSRLLYISDASTLLPVAGARGLTVRMINVQPASAPRPPAPPVVAPLPAAPPGTAPYTPPTPTPPLPAPVHTGVIPATPAWYADVPNARPYRCRAETFRIAFEERVAWLVTTDGAVARLPRVDASDDPGAPQMFSNSALTVVREAGATGGERVRFARGRTAQTTCTPQ